MFCTSCGASVGVGDAYCVACGAPTEQAAASNFTTGSSTGLRELGVGERIDAAFKAYFANFKSNALAIVVIAVPFGLLEAIISVSTVATTPVITVATVPGQSTVINSSALWTEVSGLLAIAVLSWIVGLMASATAVQIVGGSYVGAPVAWRVALRRSARRLPSLLWIFVLVAFIFLVPPAVIAGLGLLFIALNLHVVGVVILVVFGVAYVPYLFWVYVSQSLAVPTVMLEDIRGVQALRRSFALIRRQWWSVFFTLLLAGLLVIVMSGFVTVVFDVLESAARHDSAIRLVVQTLQQALTLVVFAPFSATLLVVLAIDMRVRKEGLDLELLARRISNPDSTPGAGALPTASSSGFPTIDPPSSAWRLGDSPPDPISDPK
jgi:hypothetical protein